MKLALAVAALAALPALALAQTQIPAMTVPAVQVDFESMALGATTIAAINAAHPGANIASIQSIAPLAPLANYSTGFALGRALALNPDGSGGLFIVDPGQNFGGGNGYRIDLGTVSTQVGLSIADFNGTKNVDFYLGGVLVGNSTVSGSGGPVVTFYEHISGFDRVDITGTPNYVIPEIWVESCEPCDTDCNTIVNGFDFEPFLDLLFGPGVPCSACAGDADGNGVVDAFDIEFFLACFFGPPPAPGVGPGFRIFFDESGNAGSNAAPHPGSGTLSYGNPSLLSGGRLYIYGEFRDPDQTILSPNFDITIDGGTITGAWNYNGPGQDNLTNDRRWDRAAPNPVINPGGTSVSFTAANLTHMGLKNGIFADNFDVQHDNTRNDGDTLLGYIDVVAPGAASVWLTVGQQGFAILGGGPSSPILFGYGDASVVAGVVGVRTLIADATVVSAGPPGACCVPPSACVDGETAVSCNALGGAFQGAGSQCAALPDWDGDGIPDVCDDDDDNDGVLDVDDVCPMNVVGLAVDSVSGRPLGDMNGDCAVTGPDVSGFVTQLLGP